MSHTVKIRNTLKGPLLHTHPSYNTQSSQQFNHTCLMVRPKTQGPPVSETRTRHMNNVKIQYKELQNEMSSTSYPLQLFPPTPPMFIYQTTAQRKLPPKKSYTLCQGYHSKTYGRGRIEAAAQLLQHIHSLPRKIDKESSRSTKKSSESTQHKVTPNMIQVG